MSSTNGIFVDPTTGNVGIGTAGPGAKLHVSQTTNGAPIARVNNALVQSFPPADMTNYVTDLSSAEYGRGRYVASASAQADGTVPAWSAFESSAGFWQSSNNAYATTSGIYQGSVSTIASGTSYLGEWVQLQLPVSIVPYSYTYTPFLTYYPLQFRVVASTDGTNWTLLDTQITASASWTASTPRTFTLATTSNAYSYFRFIIQTSYYAGSGTVIAVISYLTFNGTEESINITTDGKMGLGITAPREMLEVTGNAMVYGNISAGNMGMFRNRIINGDMRIAQRGTSVVASAKTYLIDRFATWVSITTGQLTTTQNTLIASDIPYQFGFRYSNKITVTTAVTSYSWVAPVQVIEGVNISDFLWGTSFGCPVTVSFWFRSNATGTHSFAIRNGSSGTATYHTTVTISSSAWQYVSFIVPPPPSGTAWVIDNTNGLEVFISPLYNPAKAVGWTTVNDNLGVSGSVNWPATLNNYIEFTGLQVEKGTIATPFEFRPYPVELQLCQRYYETVPYIAAGVDGATGTSSATWIFKVSKRVVPAIGGSIGTSLYTSSGGQNTEAVSVTRVNNAAYIVNGTANAEV